MLRLLSEERRQEAPFLQKLQQFVKQELGENSECGRLEHVQPNARTYTTYLKLSITDKNNKEEVTRRSKQLLRFLAHQPGIHNRPRLLISVTGGANLALKKELEQQLRKGLREAADVNNVWVVSGGTNGGVMKFVGSAMSHISGGRGSDEGIPIIGISTFGVLHYDFLGEFHDKTRKYTPRNKDGAENKLLDPNHNFAFMVHDEKCGFDNKYGHETKVKDEFEKYLKQLSKDVLCRLNLRITDRLQKALVDLLHSQGASEELAAQLLKFICDKFKFGEQTLVTQLAINTETDIFSFTLCAPDHNINPDEVAKELNRFVYCPESGRGNLSFHQPDESELQHVYSEGTEEIFPGQQLRVSSVLLVVDGGAVTMDVIEDAVNSSTPVVIVDGSGRAADLIAAVWRYLHSSDKDDGTIATYDRLVEMAKALTPPSSPAAAAPAAALAAVAGPAAAAPALVSAPLAAAGAVAAAAGGADAPVVVPAAAAAAAPAHAQAQAASLPVPPADPALAEPKPLRQAFALCNIKERVAIYQLSDKRSLARLMLSVMIDAIRPKAKDAISSFNASLEKLHLSLLFRDIDCARKCLELLKDDAKKCAMSTDKPTRDRGADLHKLLFQGLYWAISSHKLPFVKLFNEEIVKVEDFVSDRNYERLRALYEKAPQSYFRPFLQSELKKAMTRFVEPAAAPGEKAAGAPKDTTRANILEDVDRVLLSLMRKTGDLHVVQRTPLDSLPNPTAVAYQDLMVWAVLMHNVDMATFFWTAGGDSIPNALLCSQLAFALSTNEHLRSYSYEVAEQFATIAKTFSDLAQGLLEQCHSTTPGDAKALLLVPLTRFRLLKKEKGEDYFNCLDLAHSSESKAFLSHPACQQVLTDVWFGNIDSVKSRFVAAQGYLRPLWLFDQGVTLTPLATTRLREERGLPSPGFRARIHAIYRSPCVKFYCDILSYLTLGFVLTYMVLNKLPIILEMLAAVWVVLLALLERQQLKEQGFAAWWQSNWNKLDFFLCSFYFLGLFSRIASIVPWFHNELGLPCYSLAIYLFYVRFLRLYAGSEDMGPKLLILGRMFSDILQFFGMAIVFLLAWGVYTTALLTKEDHSDWSLSQWITSLFSQPSLYVFGDFDFAEGDAETISTLGAATTACLMVIKGLQMIACNLMLVNVLTAMFASTYDDVQKDSKQNWQFLFFDLLVEYRARPSLPGLLAYPQVLLSLHMLDRWPALDAWLRTWVPLEMDAYYEQLDVDALNRLEHFQELQTDRYLEDLERKKQQEIDTQVTDVHRMCATMETYMKEILALSSQRSLEQLENELHAAQTGSFFAAEEAPASAESSPIRPYPSGRWQQVTAALNQKKNRWQMVADNLESHPRTLSAKYPLFERGGLLLKPSARDVLTKLLDRPKTAARLGDGTDVEYYHMDPFHNCFAREAEKLRRPPNEVPDYDPYKLYGPDGKEVIRATIRASESSEPYTPRYVVLPGVLEACKDPEDLPEGKRPKNTHRTGFVGRGSFFKWGPNHAVDDIITRFKRDANGIVISHRGNRIVEFLAIQRRSDNKWALPGALATNTTMPSVAKAFGIVDANKDKHTELLNFLNSEQHVVYQGYVFDDRNTDNAWIETTARHIHDSSNFLSAHPLMDMTDNVSIAEVAWITAHRSLDLFVDHKKLLARAISHLGPRIMF